MSGLEPAANAQVTAILKAGSATLPTILPTRSTEGLRRPVVVQQLILGTSGHEPKQRRISAYQTVSLSTDFEGSRRQRISAPTGSCQQVR